MQALQLLKNMRNPYEDCNSSKSPQIKYDLYNIR